MPEDEGAFVLTTGEVAEIVGRSAVTVWRRSMPEAAYASAGSPPGKIPFRRTSGDRSRSGKGHGHAQYRLADAERLRDYLAGAKPPPSLADLIASEVERQLREHRDPPNQEDRQQ